MNIQLLFNSKNGRCTGYASERYNHQESNTGTLVQTLEGDLSDVFEQSDVDKLAGVDEPIEAAIDDPLAYRDFLILDDNGEIAFDHDYVREEDG